MDEDTLSPPSVRRQAGRSLVRHAVLDAELVTEHFLPRTRQSDAPPLPTHTERTRRRVRAAGRTASFVLKSHMSTTTRPKYGAKLTIMFHGSHESTTQCASRCAGKRGTSSSSSPWNDLAHSARSGSSARACAPASDEPVGSEINTSQNATRARQSRPVAPHSKRARTEPRPVNTHDWVRSSGRTLATTQRGAGRVNNSACSASACAARALAAWPHSRNVHAPSRDQ